MKNYLPVLCLFFLSSCLVPPETIATPTENIHQVIAGEQNPFAPKSGDDNLVQGGVILTSIDLSISTGIPSGRTKITILGSMPSVCNQLRIKVNPPDKTYEIRIQIYSILDPKIKCDNVFQQFETSILLGEYSAGEYSVWVNGAFVGNTVSY
jgi:hypothetical protein